MVADFTQSTGDALCAGRRELTVEIDFVQVTCPSCFQTFTVAAPALSELPAELDYDCEVCCRPMILEFRSDLGEVRAEARGLDD